MDEMPLALDQLLPVLPLRSTVLFPLSVATVQIDGEINGQLVDDASETDSLIVLGFADGDERTRLISSDMIANIGVVARILNRVKGAGNSRRVTLHGLERVRILAYGGDSAYFKAEVEAVPEIFGDPIASVLNTRRAVTLYEELSGLSPKYPRDLLGMMIQNRDNPGRFSDIVASGLRFEFQDRLRVLKAEDYSERLEVVLELLGRELEKARINQEVDRRVKQEIDETRREFYLRQQIKTIRKELGDEELGEDEASKYQTQLLALNLSPEINEEVTREIDRLRQIQPSASEYQVIKTFLERFFALPWGKTTEERIELDHVQRILDEGHFGLDLVKERIVEFLAVRKLNPNHKGAILCFAGPPGVGKTSLGRAIAEAIGRKFFRISVGGVRDEAEIRGHRRTYIGALPGKVLTGLTRAGTMNPLMMIDEIDKLGSDHRGDPASALLELLDPEQNDSFTDHYFNIPFDLSKVLFIVNANYIHDIPKPLLDRLELITIEGYTEKEKIEIAKRHLLPRVFADHGIADQPPRFEDEALGAIARYWSREAGVRGLKRNLERISRKLARERVEQQERARREASEEEAPKTPKTLQKSLTTEIKTEDLERFLGPRKFLHDEGMERDEVGVANGLAWTSTGGEVLVIEVIKMRGHGKVVLTGQLGEVMKESVHAAHSLIRARADLLKLEPEAFDNIDLHVHFPAGAVPKDGPSAGVTVSLAMASLFTGLPVRSDLAMTGEITLRGKVLPVGGIKDKLLAAHRAGIRRIALPKDNERDLTELPDEVRQDLQISLISSVEELWPIALLGFAEASPEPETPVKKPKSSAKKPRTSEVPKASGRKKSSPA